MARKTYTKDTPRLTKEQKADVARQNLVLARQRKAELDELGLAESWDNLTEIKQGLAEYSKATPKQGRIHDTETSKAMMYMLGQHVTSILKGNKPSKLLSKSYSVKGLIDAYQNLVKVTYPSGIHSTETQHMSHLLGSILPQLKSMLQVNVQVNMPGNDPKVQPSMAKPSMDIDMQGTEMGG